MRFQKDGTSKGAGHFQNGSRPCLSIHPVSSRQYLRSKNRLDEQSSLLAKRFSDGVARGRNARLAIFDLGARRQQGPESRPRVENIKAGRRASEAKRRNAFSIRLG